MELREIISAYRFKHRLSLQKFAELSGLSKSYVAMLEKGYQPATKSIILPSLQTIEKCAVAMGMTTQELIAQLDDDIPVSYGDEDSLNLLQLQNVFMRLSDENQKKVIEYATLLLSSES